MVKNPTIWVLAAIAAVSGCSSTARSGAGTAPPFECTSPHPEICDLEEQFHVLRYEQAEQNAAIEEAERKRRAQEGTTAAALSQSASDSLLDSPAG